MRVLVELLRLPLSSVHSPLSGIKLTTKLFQTLVSRYSDSELVDFDNFTCCLVKLEAMFSRFSCCSHTSCFFSTPPPQLFFSRFLRDLQGARQRDRNSGDEHHRGTDTLYYADTDEFRFHFLKGRSHSSQRSQLRLQERLILGQGPD